MRCNVIGLTGYHFPSRVTEARRLHLRLQAAAAGDADAQNYLGYFYYMGTESNDAERGADGNGSSASTVNNRGVPFVISKDLHKAKRFFLQAALQEHPEALYFLGELQQKAADEGSGLNRRKVSKFEIGEFPTYSL